MNEATPASEALRKSGIPHRTFRHKGDVSSLEQAARERSQRPEQVVRSLLFRSATNQFIMVLVAGTSQVSWKKLRTHLGQRRLTLATPEEVFQVTGYRIGAVSPFGLPDGIRVRIDQSALREQEISLGSGEAGAGIIISVVDAMRALPGAEIADLIDST